MWPVFYNDISFCKLSIKSMHPCKSLSSSSLSSDFLLTWYRGNIHISGTPSRLLACCTHGRSHNISPGMSIMRVDSQELPLSAIPVSCFHVILGLPGLRFPSTCMPKAVLTAPLEHSFCPYQRSLLSFRMRSRSSMPSRTSSSLDLVVTVSCSLTLQICLIIALSFRCRLCRFGFVNGQVSLAWSITLHTQKRHTWPHVLKERWREERIGSSSLNFFQVVFTRLVVESSQPPAAESMSPR